ncbi:MAG: hypothetical protein IPL41_11855 [Micropruina sp.]|nr:hypothetical protein [Micropruina sp.]
MDGNRQLQNLAWLWNAAEDTRAQDAGDLNSQHAAQAAIELCLGCAAFTQCRSWATYDRYTGLAAGRYIADGRPTGRRAPIPPAPAPLKLRDTRLLSGNVHAPTLTQHNPKLSADATGNRTVAAYFLLPLQTPLLLEPDASYAFLEDINYVEYIAAQASGLKVDIEELRRSTGKREASLRIHPIPPDATNWTPTITTALPWLPPAAVDALPDTDRPSACLVEACILMNSLCPTKSDLQDALDHVIGCIRHLQAFAAHTERRRPPRLTRQQLSPWVGVAVTRLDTDHVPAGGNFWLIRTRTDPDLNIPVLSAHPVSNSHHGLPPPSPAGGGCHAGLVPENETDTGTQREPTLRLIGGINFTTWPDLKWSRGNSHVSTLESRFTEWLASAPLKVDPCFVTTAQEST